MVSQMSDFVAGALVEKAAIFEAFIRVYMQSTTLPIHELEIVEDRSDPLLYRYFIRPKPVDAHDLSS